jgi:hypothetical protein
MTRAAAAATRAGAAAGTAAAKKLGYHTCSRGQGITPAKRIEVRVSHLQ